MQLIPLEHLNSNRDDVRKARETHLIDLCTCIFIDYLLIYIYIYLGKFQRPIFIHSAYTINKVCNFISFVCYIKSVTFFF